MTSLIQRGDVFWANLDPTIGVEIQKTRPVVVMSHDVEQAIRNSLDM